MPKELRRQKVYDPIQRILHWWLALCTITLLISGLIASNIEPGAFRSFTWQWHMVIGRCLIIGFIGRILWGGIGPRHAKLTSLIQPKSWFSIFKNKRINSVDNTDFGHHPQASAAYLSFYLLILIATISGLCLSAILHGEGPFAADLFDEITLSDPIRLIHSTIMWLILGFIFSHIIALIFHESRDEIPISQSMISGFQYRSSKEKKDAL